MFVPIQLFEDIARQDRKDKELRDKILHPGELKEVLNGKYQVKPLEPSEDYKQAIDKGMKALDRISDRLTGN